MSNPDNEDGELEPGMAQWQKTYEKQRRAQLRRTQPRRNERVKEETANSAETLRDIFKANETPSDTVPAIRPVPSRVAAVLPAHYTLIPPVELSPAPSPSKDRGSKVPQGSATASPAARPRGSAGTHSKYSTADVKPLLPTPTPIYENLQDNNGQSFLCDAFRSLTVSPTPPNSVPSSPPATPGRRRKYYVVSIGKCTGVFDSWPYVQSLTSGVSGSCQKSYPTHSEASSVYQGLKANGLVRIVRDPGDEILFGCIEDAEQ